MKKVAINIVYVLVVVVGLGLLVYPHLSFWLAQNNQVEILNSYQEEISSLDPGFVEQEIEAATHYNAQLRGENIVDPFVQGSGMLLPEDYTSVLAFNDIMARVKIPKINVDLPIFHGTSEETLAKGIGHLEGSSLPIGGPSTHAVITGHTGLSAAKMFTDLVKVEIGDEFYIYVLGEILAYRVDQIKVVEPTHLDELLMVEGKDYVTLITCTPYGVNSHRLLVRGTRVDYTPQQVQEAIAAVQPVIGNETLLLVVGGIAIGVLGLFALLSILLLKNKLRKQTHQSKEQNMKHIYKKQSMRGHIHSSS